MKSLIRKNNSLKNKVRLLSIEGVPDSSQKLQNFKILMDGGFFGKWFFLIEKMRFGRLAECGFSWKDEEEGRGLEYQYVCNNYV